MLLLKKLGWMVYKMIDTKDIIGWEKKPKDSCEWDENLEKESRGKKNGSW